jgi:hypothetical protein
MGADAKSYMRKGFLIYEEMRKYLVINEEAVNHIYLCNRSVLDSLINEENFVFFFISVPNMHCFHDCLLSGTKALNDNMNKLLVEGSNRIRFYYFW